MTRVCYFQRVYLPAHENAHAASEEEGEAGEDKKTVRSSSIIKDRNDRLVLARTLCCMMSTASNILLAFFFLHLPELSKPYALILMEQQQLYTCRLFLL
jgi:hypothetical protein